MSHQHTESFNKRSLYSGRHNYTLLNGDCNLYNVAYPAYIKSAMPYIRFFQVPHHGSWYSWHDMPELDDLDGAQMIVSYGTGNSHGHPHDFVTKRINLMHPHWKLQRNTEKKKYHYHITSYI